MGADGWSADFDDPSNFFDPLFTSAAIQDEDSQNRSFFTHRELDSVLAQARGETNPATRRALYHRADSIIRDEAPWAVIYGFRYYDVHQGYVQGYTPHPHSYLDVGSVWLNTVHRRLSTHGRHAPPWSITTLALHLTSRRQK